MAKSPVRMSDVARQAGVSTMTVSRVLNQPGSVAPETRERILQAIGAQGYVPNDVAGSLRARRGRGVVCIVPHIANSVFSDTLQGLNDALRPASMHVMLGTSGYASSEEARVLEEFVRLRPEAVVLWGTRRHPKSRALLRRLGVPVMEVFDLVLDPFDQVIGFSNERAMGALVDHLLDSGRRRIAFVGSNNERDVSSTQRADGWRMALRAAAIDPAGLMFEADGTTVGGEQVLRCMVASGVGFDAVCCSSDLLAVGVLIECRRMGIMVPGDIAVAGFGDNPLAQAFDPPLSTVRLPRYAIGKVAGEQVLRRMAGEPVQHRAIDLGYEVLVRAST
ncbi:MAG: LacI family DNA-binding transcriptional regulator [Rhodoferax sp.]|nr:LacI family DNA-binding transcriptional regulator [Rhodoferax sp.]